LDVSRNSLVNIDALDEFENLKKIKASSNYIAGCNLRLFNLKKLDLAHNYLKEMPELHFIPQLTDLNISDNLITHLPQITKKLHHDHTFANLVSFRFNDNIIEQENYHTGQECIQQSDIDAFSKKLYKFKKLELLFFGFLKPDKSYQSSWTPPKYAKSLTHINGVKIEEYVGAETAAFETKGGHIDSS